MDDLVAELQDFRHLRWDERTTTSGTSGTFPKARAGRGGRAATTSSPATTATGAFTAIVCQRASGRPRMEHRSGGRKESESQRLNGAPGGGRRGEGGAGGGGGGGGEGERGGGGRVERGRANITSDLLADVACALGMCVEVTLAPAAVYNGEPDEGRSGL